MIMEISALLEQLRLLSDVGLLAVRVLRSLEPLGDLGQQTAVLEGERKQRLEAGVTFLELALQGGREASQSQGGDAISPVTTRYEIVRQAVGVIHEAMPAILEHLRALLEELASQAGPVSEDELRSARGVFVRVAEIALEERAKLAAIIAA